MKNGVFWDVTTGVREVMFEDELDWTVSRTKPHGQILCCKAFCTREILK
jgi:hypothetical protein